MDQKFNILSLVQRMAASRFVGYAAVVAVAGAGYYAYRSEVGRLREQVGELEQRMSFVKSPPENVTPGSTPVTTVPVTRWGDLQPALTNTVVQIFSYMVQFDWRQPYKTPEQGQSMGSGFFIDAEGTLVTNAHVVIDAVGVAIQIPALGKRRWDVDILCVSPDRDLALLKIKPDQFEYIKKTLGGIRYITLGDSDTVYRADEIMALGYPLGQQSLKSTTGVVSGREHLGGRMMIQISAPINPGNSGGPSLNERGEAIGVNTAGIMEAQNVGYIIPVNELKLFLNQYSHVESEEKPVFLRKPFLGILFNQGTEALARFLGNPEPGGLYVVEPYKGSPLCKAGIQAGDMIYSIDGYDIDLYGEMFVPWSEDRVAVTDYISRLPLGHRMHVVAYRKGKRIDLRFTFSACDLAPIRYMFPGYEKIDYEIFGGMVFMQLALNHLPILVPAGAGELARYADIKHQLEQVVIVSHVFPDSVASRTRVLKTGDVIRQLNDVVIKTLDDVRAALEKGAEKGFVTVKTSENVFTAMPFDIAVKDEPRLSRIYFYPITDLTKKLMSKIGIAVA